MTGQEEIGTSCKKGNSGTISIRKKYWWG